MARPLENIEIESQGAERRSPCLPCACAVADAHGVPSCCWSPWHALRSAVHAPMGECRAPYTRPSPLLTAPTGNLTVLDC